MGSTVGPAGGGVEGENLEVDDEDFGGLKETEEVEEDLKRAAENLGGEDGESSGVRRKLMMDVDRVIAVAESRAAAEKEAAA